MSLCAFASPNASGDVLVSFPAETDSARVAEITRAFQEASGLAARGATAIEGLVTQPEARPPEKSRKALSAANKAYRNLDLDEARSRAEEAERSCLESAAGTFLRCKEILFDVYLLRGIIASTRGDDDGATVSFRTAHGVMPEKVLDPRRYPPKIVGAFGKACSAELPVSRLKLKSHPEGATLTVNGVVREAGATWEVGQGRLIVDGEMPGYRYKLMPVDIGAVRDAELTVQVKLLPLDESAAWMDLRRVLGAGQQKLSHKRVRPLFKRFGIDRIVLLRKSESIGQLFDVRVGRPGSASVSMIGNISGTESVADEEFAARLSIALGVEGPVVDEPKKPEKVVIDPGAGSLEDDKEDSPVRFEDDEVEDDDNEAQKIFKSPWFWVGVGVVVAVVGGVVIGTQVGD